MKKNFRIVLIVMIIVVCAYVSVSFALFQRALSNNLFQESKNQLTKSDESSIHFIKQTFDDFESQLHMIDDFITLYSGNDDAIIKMLEQMNQKNEEVNYGLINKTGSLFTIKAMDVDLDWESICKVMSTKKRYISNIIQIQKQPSILVIIPIMKDTQIVGGIIGIYKADYLQELFSKSLYSGIGATMIIQSDGNVVAGYQGMEKYPDFYTMLDQFHFPDKTFDKEHMLKSIQKQENGFLVYEQGNKQRYMGYAPIGINDWYVINLVMAESLTPRYSNILQQSMLLAASYAIVFVLLMFFLYRISRNMKKVQEQALQVHRFEMLAKFQKSAIIFDYDFQKKYLHVSSNYENKFHISAKAASDLKVAEQIMVDPVIKDVIIRQIKEQDSVHAQLQLIDYKGYNRWFEIEGGVVFNEQHQPVSLIGFLYDIDDAYLEKQQLVKKANIDDLTNTLTKSELLHQIDVCLKENTEQLHSLLFVDLDNFKSINDTYGHLIGDNVLRHMGDLLLRESKKGIVGRFGGDEFVIFLTNTSMEARLEEFAQHLLDTVKEEMKYPVSISIGIAIYGKDAHCVNELLEHADSALYRAKESGKDKYRIY